MLNPRELRRAALTFWLLASLVVIAWAVLDSRACGEEIQETPAKGLRRVVTVVSGDVAAIDESRLARTADRCASGGGTSDGAPSGPEGSAREHAMASPDDAHASSGGSFVLLAGVGSTHGMGERGPAAEAAVVLAGRSFEAEAAWYGADKVESGTGWGAKGSAEVRWRSFGLGTSYTYRDGGEWTKSYMWARASVGAGPVRLIGEAAVGGYNRERRLELRMTGRHRALVVEPRVFVVRHLQGTGYGAALLVGVAGGAR